MPPRESLDAVEAYNRIAPAYQAIAERRRAYLQAIDDVIASRIPPGSRSLLDVGGGDGKRAVAIAERIGIKEIVLVEPSLAMRADTPRGVEVWPMRAEAIPQGDRRFDVIICLWNVLGHISRQNRAVALSKMAARLEDEGTMFIDLNHRYNAGAYGWLPTIGRWAYDHLSPNDRHGDVAVHWDVNGILCSTTGHVFTDREFHGLATAAGLTIVERIVVDYGTGQGRRFVWQGNLLYVLRRQDLTASPNVSPT